MTNTSLKPFTIILVDDHHEQMTRKIAEIEEYLNGKGFALELIPDKTGRQVIDSLREVGADIILADSNLSGGSGADIIKEVRRKKFPTDILYYSAGGIKNEEIVSMSQHYISVEILDGIEIVPIVKKMIDKNLLKWDDVFFLRGIIISHA
ncbi:MAG: hypothetical protein KGL95_04555, partial [Patescibacteria group bacterium]|nr:hypothetical protein [Patescibacteria group bacterium]